MKRIIILIVVLTLLVGCTAKPTPTKTPSYVITRETGLYKSVYDDNYTETLKAKTRVKPANNAASLTCRTVDVYEVLITFCEIEVFLTGQKGWVIQNAMQKN